MPLRPFRELAAADDPPLDELCLALAAEFREADADGALQRLDALGDELSRAAGGSPEEEALACAALLGGTHRYVGDSADYDHPDNSMLDLVLERRRGLPILLSAVYVEVARRAGVRLAGVGLPGHFVVGHTGASPPVLLDPFNGGALVEVEADEALLRPWSSVEIAMRMLNNLLASYQRRGDLAAAIRAAELRLALPADDELRAGLKVEARALRARLN